MELPLEQHEDPTGELGSEQAADNDSNVSSTLAHFSQSRCSYVAYEKLLPETDARSKDPDLRFRDTTHTYLSEMSYVGPRKPFRVLYQEPLMERSRHPDPLTRQLDQQALQTSKLPPELTLGPVIGLVTCTTARILVEVSADFTLRMTLQPRTGSLGQVVSEQLFLCCSQPRAFEFQGLQPGTYYDIVMNICAPGLLHAGFRTLRPGWRIRDEHARVGCVSQELWTNTSDDGPWKALGMLACRGAIDYVLHVGGAVVLDPDHDARIRHALEVSPNETIANVREEMIIDVLRDAYRKSWTRPFVRQVLANCPNLMACSGDDLGCPWWVSEEKIQGASFELVLSCALRVYYEYQRQLCERIPVLPVPWTSRALSSWLLTARDAPTEAISGVPTPVNGTPPFAEETLSEKLHHIHCFGDVGIVCTELAISAFHEGVTAEEKAETQMVAIEHAFFDNSNGSALFSHCRCVLIVLPQPLFRNTTSSSQESEELSRLHGQIKRYSQRLSDLLIDMADQWTQQHPKRRMVCFVTADRCWTSFDLLGTYNHVQLTVPPMVLREEYQPKKACCLKKTSDASELHSCTLKQKGCVRDTGCLVLSIYGMYLPREHAVTRWLRRERMYARLAATLVPNDFETRNVFPLYDTKGLHNV